MVHRQAQRHDAVAVVRVGVVCRRVVGTAVVGHAVPLHAVTHCQRVALYAAVVDGEAERHQAVAARRVLQQMGRMRGLVVVYLPVPDDGVAHLLRINTATTVVHRQIERVHSGIVCQRMVIQVHARGCVHIPMPYKAVAHRIVFNIVDHILTCIGNKVRRKSSIGGNRKGIGSVG